MVHNGLNRSRFNGFYFFADYCSNEIGTIDFDGNDYTIHYSEQFSGNNWTTFGQDMNPPPPSGNSPYLDHFFKKIRKFYL